MAGHSQFKNIMHRKGRQDAVRSRLFSKLAREIAVAAREGGPDVTGNPRLRLAVNNARAQSMPKDNIERAIRRGQGSDAAMMEEVRYEGYGPAGVAIIVEVLTDNRNRSASSVRACFSKHGGALGETGSVAYLFAHVGEIIYPHGDISEEQMFEAGLEAGADDVQCGAEHHIITCPFADIHKVTALLGQLMGDPQSARPVWRPLSLTPVGEDKAGTLLKLVNMLEDDEDVQNVFANFDIGPDVLDRLVEG